MVKWERSNSCGFEMHSVSDDRDRLMHLDEELSQRYGAYASYESDASPALIEYYGENPADELSRLLDIYSRTDTRLLDIGCGAGQMLCETAGRVAEAWGVDMNPELLDAARYRAGIYCLHNIYLVNGNVSFASEVERLPDAYFDLAYSQRGPNLNNLLTAKLQEGAFFIQELISNFDGYPLQEIFGRKYHTPYPSGDQQALLSQYAELNLHPVSLKDYFYEEFFRDADHLEAYVRQSALLSNWRHNPRPYEPERDRPALELYAHYNTTPKGVRLLRQRKIFVLRKASG